MPKASKAVNFPRVPEPQDQWNAFFEAKHDGSMAEKCKKFSQNDLHDIQHYMHDHAMDSDQPETCS